MGPVPVFDLADIPPVEAEPATSQDGGPAKEPAADDMTRLSDPIRDAVNAARQRDGLAALATCDRLDEAARRGAEAMLREIVRNPAGPTTPEELHIARVTRDVPGTIRLTVQVAAADCAERLIAKAPAWQVAADAEATHLAVGLAAGRLADGRPIEVAVALAAHVAPDLSPEEIAEGCREFHVRCPHCGADYVTQIALPSKKDTSLQTNCPQCDGVADVYGIDQKGVFHRPPWFMRRYQPDASKAKDPLSMWLFVLTNCRYADDAGQYHNTEVWQTAEETYRLRRGDCEDLAILLADWLSASGYEARAVLGEEGGSGHAWVVMHDGEHDYLLEATGGRANYRRVPPRAAVLPQYRPEAQFDQSGLWLRKSSKWTGDYRSTKEWSRAPWPLESVPHRPSK